MGRTSISIQQNEDLEAIAKLEILERHEKAKIIMDRLEIKQHEMAKVLNVSEAMMSQKMTGRKPILDEEWYTMGNELGFLKKV